MDSVWHMCVCVCVCIKCSLNLQVTRCVLLAEQPCASEKSRKEGREPTFRGMLFLVKSLTSANVMMMMMMK